MSAETFDKLMQKSTSVIINVSEKHLGARTLNLKKANKKVIVFPDGGIIKLSNLKTKENKTESCQH